MSADLKARFDSKSRRRIAAAMIVCALATATPIAAADKTTSTPYQAYLFPNCLDGSNFCNFTSETVPDGARLDVQRVACQGWVISTLPPSFTAIAELRTGVNEYVDRIDFLEVKSTPANGGSAWAISERTLMFIPAGDRLRINVNSGPTGVGSYGCTISGYMIAVP
jgi:hypothetical protein